MRPSVLGLLLATVVLGTVPAGAEQWPRARIRRLPDEAFAVIERGPDGRVRRRLPHHDETGALDLPHLIAARARLGQVKWLDPANAAIARRHLEGHWREIRSNAIRPRRFRRAG